MKRHFLISYILSAFLALVAVSCNKESAPDTPRRAVRFNAAAANVALPDSRGTRASDASWALNDMIGVRMYDAQGNTVNGYENRPYVVTDAAKGTFAPVGEDMYYPVDGSKVGFTAYYPYKKGVTDSYTVWTGGDQSNPAAFDLLLCKTEVNYNKETTSVPLVFRHQLAKLIIKTTPGPGITSLAGMSVRLDMMKCLGSFNLHTGYYVMDQNSYGNVSLVPITDGKVYQAIVLPGWHQVYMVKFELNGRKYWTVPPDNDFDRGKTYVWNLTVEN